MKVMPAKEDSQDSMKLNNHNYERAMSARAVLRHQRLASEEKLIYCSLVMQQTLLCTACGAEMLDEARFCRKCGQPSTRFKEESVTEGTTRILETPEHNKVFGQEFYEQHGSLAQPTTRIPPQVNQTSRNLTVEPKRQNWVLISAILFAGLALIVAALIFTLKDRSTPTVIPPIVIKPQIQP